MVLLESKTTESRNEDFDCLTCQVRNGAPLCGKLDSSTLESFSRNKKLLNFEKGQSIFYKGNPNYGAFILCHGSALLSEGSHGQKMNAVRVVFPGEIVDKTTFLDAGMHLYSARALEQIEVAFFEQERFLSMLKSSPELAFSVMKHLSEEIETVRDSMRGRLNMKAQQRLAGLLCYLGQKFGQTSDLEMVIPNFFKREELAELIGMTVESLVRWLSYFKKEQWIRISGRKIIILEIEKLKQIMDHSFLAQSPPTF
jgi:CRP-like cAMP-binding protein